MAHYIHCEIIKSSNGKENHKFSVNINERWQRSDGVPGHRDGVPG